MKVILGYKRLLDKCVSGVCVCLGIRGGIGEENGMKSLSKGAERWSRVK